MYARVKISPVTIFGFPRLVAIPPLFHTHLTPLSEVCMITLARQHIITTSVLGPLSQTQHLAGWRVTPLFRLVCSG